MNKPDKGPMEDLAKAIIAGNAPEAKRLVGLMLAAGVPARQILEEGMMYGMQVTGTKFKNNEFYVPEVLVASRAFKMALECLRYTISDTGAEPLAKTVAIGAVRGDLHDIGKNIVAMVLEGAGFEVNDLGVDVKPEQFVEAVKCGADVVAMTALLTTTMPAMIETVKALRNAGVREKAIVMIGGAPVTENYADEIGADGFALDAYGAVEKAKQLLNL